MTEEWERLGFSSEAEQDYDQEESAWAQWEKEETDLPFQEWRHDMLCDAWDMREK